MFSSHNRQHFKADLLASLGVFVVALPLSVGIAVASNVPPAAGLIAAIIGGVVVGMISGAPMVVSGPAAGLAAIIFDYVNRFGFERLLHIAFLAGIFQILFSFFGLSRIFNLTPQAVLKGMLAGIGLMIATLQIYVILGKTLPESFNDAVLMLPSSVWEAMAQVEVYPIIFVGLLAFAVQIIWGRLPSSVPAALPAVVIASLVSLLFEMPRVDIEPIGSMAVLGFNNLVNSETWANTLEFVLPALTLAIVASAESLLTAKAISQYANGPRVKTDLDKELFAQGTGNLLSGILGGLPITGVIVRSAANINFGGKTRNSTILHGLWILVFLLAFPSILEMIPLAALASVLIITGYNLFNPPQFVQAFRDNKAVGITTAVTCIGVVTTDLLMGLGIGLGTAIALALSKDLWEGRGFRPGKSLPTMQKVSKPR